jgi:NitT/TauT family transport system substrate-binding protein
MPDIVKQMGQKQVEVANISYQFAFLGQKQNICRLIASGDELLVDAQTTMSAVRDSVQADRREVVVRFAMAYIQAGRLFNKAAGDPANYPDVLRFITKHVLVKDVELLKAIAPHWEWISVNGEPNADSVMAQQDFWNSPFKMVEQKVSRDRILDLSIAAEASNRLDRDNPFSN